jgi:hypothetical protein
MRRVAAYAGIAAAGVLAVSYSAIELMKSVSRNIVTVEWRGSRLHTWFIEAPAALCSTGPLGHWVFEDAERVDREIVAWILGWAKALPVDINTAASANKLFFVIAIK